MENKPKLLAEAIIKVMQEVKGMEKNSNIGTGRSAYNGTKDQDVKEVFNEALSKNGLCLLPIGIDEETQIDRWQEDTQYGVKQKQAVFTKVNTKYLLLHESGESVELAGYGHGVDPQDKGAGKATTYALKNCLLYTFLTPVGKIDDTDQTHSKEIQTPQQTIQAPKEIPTPKRLTPTALEKCKTTENKDLLEDILKVYALSDNEKTIINNRLNSLKNGSK